MPPVYRMPYVYIYQQDESKVERIILKCLGMALHKLFDKCLAKQAYTNEL